ncbi:hypothetical protein SNOG_07147 [Parastagonospora nodorum SN15]|uniref:Uncharacterized protein n=1 Tax=Phaeosphaeria nodorum (strain SN15 / ATCC MYA-4574 / FGSC 10173) TaxID=321614 RepID=Q0UM67_PHANO|nr:hypothetical protein SNOG_07147 [Parastagonospora nodorum SN15]EAT85798.1 hypothetical protein SNOG_07147 [Parastagonospora nodorum SN15]
MAKTKPQDKKSKKSGKNGTSSKPKASPEELLIQAATLLQTSQPEEALVAAKRALNLLQPSSTPSAAALPALNLLGEINVELGDPESAREAFEAAIAIDPQGTSDGAEKFLWMAQLNEEGGAASLRHDDAKAALARSMELWKDLDPDDPKVPDFSTRISLSRLLMEAELEDEAIEVLERLIGENDGSVEAWYLGGWCLHLLSGKQKAKGEDDVATSLLRASRDWLENCLKLYTLLEYEDERLKEHADEILKELNDTLGPSTGEEEEDWEDAGEDDDDEDDEEMDGT